MYISHSLFRHKLCLPPRVFWTVLLHCLREIVEDLISWSLSVFAINLCSAFDLSHALSSSDVSSFFLDNATMTEFYVYTRYL